MGRYSKTVKASTPGFARTPLTDAPSISLPGRVWSGIHLSACTSCTFDEQALRSLETGLDGWSLPKNWKRMTAQQLEYGLRVPNPERMVVLKQVMHQRNPLAP